MAPFLRDEGPPVSPQTIQRCRESLPLEFGYEFVHEKGREVLVVRVPKAKPDYLHDLAEVAFYVNLDQIRATKDVLLVGHEKASRLEPQILRDNIRVQAREDVGVVEDLRRALERNYGCTLVHSPSNHHHRALAMRIPKHSLAQFGPEDVSALRAVLHTAPQHVEQCQYAYIVADRDFERVGRRVLRELLGTPEPVATGALHDGRAPAVPAPRPPAPETGDVSSAPLPGSVASHSPAGPPPLPPATAPSPSPAPLAEDRQVHEEYEVVTRKPAPQPATPAAPRAEATPPPAPGRAPEPGYEVVARPGAEAPAPLPAGEAEGGPAREVEILHEEYEVYTSKPKPKAEAPAITPPGMGGFKNALNLAATGQGPVPARTKEYEVMGRTPPPTAMPSPTAPVAPAPSPLPVAHPPRDDPRGTPPRASLPVPQADNGAPILGRVAPASPENVLAERFREAGYEVVEGLRAQGTVFAFAAHRANGRRVLVKRAAEFGPDEAATLAQLVVALGADVCLVVADRIHPGTRLATWGTRLEVFGAADASTLSF